MIIYKITNKINNKCYIGQTINNLEKRWSAHCSDRSDCRKLKNAIKKYGKENFAVEIIDTAHNLEELNKKEEYWIKTLDSMNTGYNLIAGGNNKTPSKETREKRSKSMMGKNTYKRSKEQVEKTASKLRGRKQDPKTIIKRTDAFIKSIQKSIVDMTTGVRYTTTKKAANALGLSSSNITDNLKGKSQSCGGRYFCYTKDWDGKILPQTYQGKGSYQYKKLKKVKNLDTGIVYNSYKEIAEKFDDVNVNSLRIHLRKNKPYKNYRFSYV